MVIEHLIEQLLSHVIKKLCGYREGKTAITEADLNVIEDIKRVSAYIEDVRFNFPRTEVISDLNHEFYTPEPLGIRFNLAISTLKEKGFGRLVSLKEMAELTIQEGIRGDIGERETLVREGSIYVNDKYVLLVRSAPELDDPDLATNPHWFSHYDSIVSRNQFAKAKEGSIKVYHNKLKPIPTNRFAEDEIMVWAFGEFAEQYGLWLKDEVGIKQMPISLPDPNGIESYLELYPHGLSRQLTLGSINDLSISTKEPDVAYRVRAVRNVQ